MTGARARLRSWLRAERAPTGRRWPDLRLAGIALGAWLSALAALSMPWRVSIACAAVVAGAAALGSAALHRSRAARMPQVARMRHAARVFHAARSRAVRTSVGHRAARRSGAAPGVAPALPASWGWAVLATAVGIAAGLAVTGLRVQVRDGGPVAALAREHATVRAELTIDEDPRPARGVGPTTYLMAAHLTGIAPADHARTAVNVPVLLRAADAAWASLLPGQPVGAQGRLVPARGPGLRAAILVVTGAPLRVGRAPWAQRAAGRLRAGLQHACVALPRQPGGLLPGLVVGDTSRLDPAVRDDFRAVGMTHLVAVSGANVAIVLTLVLAACRWCRCGPAVAVGACALALAGFVILVRPSPSVLRAATMGGIALLALALGRPGSGVPALATVVTVLVLADPQLAADPGFGLSVLATAGLLLVAPGWRDGLARRGVPVPLAEAVAVSAAAQVTCAPLVAALSGTVGVAAIPANLLAAPAVPPATVLGVAAALLSPLAPTAAAFAAWLASWPARWLVLVARYGAQAPAGVAAWPGGAAGGVLLAAVLLALLLAGRHPMVRRVGAVAAIAAVLGALPVRLVASGWPPPDWLLVVCDVGQGDEVVLPAGAGAAVVVDSGPDPAAGDRCLSRLGVRQVPLLVITHFHVDHVGGVAGVFRGRSVARVLTPGYDQPGLGRDQVRSAAAAAGVPTSPVAAGSGYSLGALHLAVIGPQRVLTGTRSDPNNNSVMLRVTMRGHVLLLAGDAEEDEQQNVLTAAGAQTLRAEVLKLAHHGSAYQQPEFLDAVDPAVALVSVGAGNPYGHPNASVLARLARSGARVLRTDLDGDLAVVLRDGHLAVVVRGREPGRRPP